MTQALDPNFGLVLATAVAVALAALTLLGSWARVKPRRVPAGPETVELGSEPPALVDLLTGGFEVGDDSVAATLVDLAARGHLGIENVGGELIIRTVENRPDEELLRYENRVLERVMHLAGGTGIVPAKALTTGDGGLSDRWWKGFVREVTHHGRELGLCTRRWSFRALAPVWITVGLAAGLAYLTLETAGRNSDLVAWGSLENVLFAVVGFAAVGMVYTALKATRGSAQRDTDLGRERAAYWLGVREWMQAADYQSKRADHVAIWDRHLAYATALDLTPRIVKEFPFAGEHDKRAWSEHSGTWRRVNIRYWSVVPGWGDKPTTALFVGVGRVVMYGIFTAVGFWLATSTDPALTDLSDATESRARLGGLVLLGLTIPAVLRSVVRAVAGLRDLFGTTTIEGVVLRSRQLEHGHQLPWIVRFLIRQQAGGSNRTQYEQRQRMRREWWMAVDTGGERTITALRINEGWFRLAQQGYRVRVTTTPILGYVKNVEVLDRDGAQAVPQVAHELQAEAVNVGAAKANDYVGKLAERLSMMGAMTDENGESILDLRDEDGQSLSDRLQLARQEMAKAQGKLPGASKHGTVNPDGSKLGGGLADNLLSRLEQALDRAGTDHATADQPGTDRANEPE